MPKRLLVGDGDSINSDDCHTADDDDDDDAKSHQWAANIKLLMICFGLSGFLNLTMFFFPSLRNLPIFGNTAARTWLWTFNPSLAYVGQGIIMGVETTLHMTLGAVVGWGLLSPLAHNRGWAPGPTDDWDSGSKGWIVWVSLSIMLADAIISLVHIACLSIAALPHAKMAAAYLRSLLPGARGQAGYSPVHNQDDEPESQSRSQITTDPERQSLLLPRNSPPTGDLADDQEKAEEDAPKDQLVGSRVIWIGLVTSILLCIATIRFVFEDLMPLYATALAVAVALVLSVMGVRALGETDLNPVSGISKLAQLFFAFVIPASHKSGVLINLISGAVVCYGNTPQLTHFTRS